MLQLLGGAVFILVGVGLLLIRKPLIKFQLSAAREMKVIRADSPRMKRALEITAVAFSTVVILMGLALIVGWIPVSR